MGLPFEPESIDLAALDVSIALDSLYWFLRGAWPTLEPATPFQDNWHIHAVCDHIQALLEDRNGPNGEPCPQNLLINVPPGSMKSLIFSVAAPAWVWLRRPSWRAIYASGTPSIVSRDSVKCRALIRSEWYQDTFKPAWKISEDQDEKQHFANTEGGFRKGTGAGGTVTGERADFLGVDDPNDAKEIHSEAHREQINLRWWDLAFHNRIADPAKSKRGLIMQRLHEEDLAGYLLRKEAGQWAHLAIPMEADPKGPGDRKTWIGWSDPRVPGELLFPARFTPAYLADEKQTLGSAGYAGQMQQRPSPASGNRFQRAWWRFWTTGKPARLPRPDGCNQTAAVRLPEEGFDEMIQSWDMTFKDTDGTDFVCGGVWGRVGADKYLLAVVHARLSFTESCRAVADLTARYPRAWEKLIEDKANGPAVINALAAKISGLVPVNPEGGKESRAAAIEPQVEAGNVYLWEDWDKLSEFIDEFAAFPKGAHDDYVDMTSQALIRLTEDSDVANSRALAVL